MSRLSTDKFNNALGKRLALIRDGLRLSQKQMGDAIGSSDKALANWERGVRELPSAIAAQLNLLYDVDANWLLTGERKGVDVGALEQIISGVEALLAKRGQQLPPEKKAKLIAYVYGQWAKGSLLDEQQMDAVIALAA